jgi:hypothetical protein
MKNDVNYNLEHAADQADKYHDELMVQQIKKGGVDADMGRAAMFAKNGSRADGLLPTATGEGLDGYTPEQVAKAACHAREDVAMLVFLQRVQLKHLHKISSLLWVCIGLLSYIAYKLS